MTDTRTLPSTLEGWELSRAADYIVDVQQSSGLIPWYPGGPADPWDHVESAMALTVAGEREAAADAYRWLADTQMDDGSWWAMYNGADEAGESQKETHRAAYIAVGLDHYHRVTGDPDLVEELWPTVENAVEFALSHQADTGEVYWAAHPDGSSHHDALVSGNASIYKSLESGVELARALDRDRESWLDARARIGEALRTRPDRFDRTWESKDRFSMYWFYPVLCGVLRGDAARERLDADWDRFVEAGLGCRCVDDEPWVTVAESSELVLSLLAADREERALEVFEWLFQWLDEADGTFWTGYQFENESVWPEQKPTWTAGAAILAADALGHLSPAAQFFVEHAPE